ncbi:MAG TPA: phage holin family protein [Acidimicrobiia bacterium]|nr:phage holin family protein [Acidimicrobiia bacterium]
MAPTPYSGTVATMIHKAAVVASRSREREKRDMSNVNELPQLAAELVELSKEYLRQETLEPAKRLGKVAGLSVGAGMLISLGVILLATAGMRFLIEVFPEGGLWTALALLTSALVAAGAAGIVVWRATR